jgi:uncharacterized membrane protein
MYRRYEQRGDAASDVHLGLWLWLAWANGKGQDWARMMPISSFGLLILAVLGTLAHQAAAYAPPDMIAAAVVWAIGLASLVLIFTPEAGRYHRPVPVRQ